MTKKSQNDINWLSLADLVGLPGLPNTYSGVRSAWRRNRFKNVRLCSNSKGENDKVYIHISELTTDAREAHIARHDEPIADAVERACEMIESFDPKITGPIRSLILLIAMSDIYGVDHVNHVMRIITSKD